MKEQTPQTYNFDTMKPDDWDNFMKSENLNIKDQWGITPLIYACFEGNFKLAKSLIKAGADVNFKSSASTPPSPSDQKRKNSKNFSESWSGCKRYKSIWKHSSPFVYRSRWRNYFT